MMSPNQFTENTITAINLAVDISKGNMQQSIRPEALALGLLMQNDGLIPRVIEKMKLNLKKSIDIPPKYTFFSFNSSRLR